MKKLGKFLLGATVVAALAGGAYYAYKKIKELKETELDDLDLEDDFFEDDVDCETSKSTDERDYINISIEKSDAENVEDKTKESKETTKEPTSVDSKNI
jgi:hypothetical protein